jgi:hypothetical protein
MDASTKVCDVHAAAARFIKLGEGGEWERLCLEDGTLRLAYYGVPHDAAEASDVAALRAPFLARGDDARTASSHARQILDFYHAPPDTLWITFANGFLWWCFAESGVTYLGASRDEAAHGSRLRRTRGGWSNRSRAGRPLRVAELNGRLTSVAGYRGTICNVAPLAYLLDRINDIEPAEVIDARAAREQVLVSTEALMRLLTWQDFELLVELVFSASGWRRIGHTGGTQKTIDLDLVLPSTGERAFVQVKSRTDQQQLDDYVAQLAGREETRMFYVYHSARGAIAAADPRVILVGPRRLSAMVLQAGLFDWLITRAR